MADNFGPEKNKWHSAARITRRTAEAIRRSRLLWWACASVLVVIVLILFLWKVPQWQVARVEGLNSTQRFDRENEARKTLATILGGIVVLAGGFATWRNLRLLQEGQITDRFTKAIEQLGAIDASGEKKLEVRLGGIYALERIAKDSERDHWPIMEVLSTYVRQNAQRKEETREQEKLKPEKATIQGVHRDADIQAILTVLGRRNPTRESAEQWLNLIGTDLRGAFLYKAHLRRANLTEANLGGAILFRADLTQAYLDGANLSGAYLNGATLVGVYLRRAYLSEAKGLTQEQIDKALGDADTKLPPGLHMPETWKE
jgi:Pentapeptide repeats (8 copies)